MFPFANIKGKLYADGGLKDSIPIRKSIADGNKKNVIVLTRNKGYMKKQSKVNQFTYKLYKNKYPKLADVLNNRYKEYNEQIKYCEKLEKNGEAIIIRPTIKMDILRFDRNKDKLKSIYQNGYDIVINDKERILKYML